MAEVVEQLAQQFGPVAAFSCSGFHLKLVIYRLPDRGATVAHQICYFFILPPKSKLGTVPSSWLYKSFEGALFFLSFFLVLGIKPRASCVPGKHSITEPYSTPLDP